MKLQTSKPGVGLPTSVEPDYLRSIVESLAFPREMGDGKAIQEARDLIHGHFNAVGLKSRESGRYKNIVVGDPSTAEVLIGSHYDTVAGTPGADDNSSAVASIS